MRFPGGNTRRCSSPLYGLPYKEFVGYTIERCSALQELCSVDSVKGAVNARWKLLLFCLTGGKEQLRSIFLHGELSDGQTGSTLLCVELF